MANRCEPTKQICLLWAQRYPSTAQGREIPPTRLPSSVIKLSNCNNLRILRYDTIGEFNVDSKAEYTA